MICTIDEFYCIRNTAPAVIIKVTEGQLLATSPEICRDGMNFISGKYTCTEPPIATPSASTATISSITFASPSAIAIGNSVYIIWLALGILILLQAIGIGTYIFKK